MSEYLLEMKKINKLRNELQLKLNREVEDKEIAEILDKDIKAIDNALQRIKVKIKKLKD